MVKQAPDRFLSPFRYPGGKRKLASFIANIIAAQPEKPARYVEPFAGGAGVALHLLVHKLVDEVVINDLDPGVAAFWRATFQRTDELVEQVRSCRPTIELWHARRETYLKKDGDDVELGFATFFLNRTNRSGIIGARPIGGLAQDGRWGLDARYDGEQLATRILRLAEHRARVTVCEQDGVGLAEAYLAEANSFLYLDPPYLMKGDDLYLDTFAFRDHKRLASLLAPCARWVLTYDKDPRVLRLYPGLRCAMFDIAHTAQHQHIGTEYAVFADGLVVPSLEQLGRGESRYVVRRSALAATP